MLYADSFGKFKTAAFLVLSIAYISPATAASFDQLYTFGDSTVDSGWWNGALSGQCGPVAAPCTTGNTVEDNKISSAIANGGTGAPVGVGLMNTQILASYYGLSSVPANQPGGTNYAISGSLSVETNGAGNLNPNPNLPSTVGQISSYLGAHSNVADSGALYMISSGANDVTYAQNNFGGVIAAEQNYLSNQAATLASAVKMLQVDGATHFIVNGLQGSGQLATFFTTSLFSDLTGLGINFIGSDIAALIQKVENDPVTYGFTLATVFPGVPGSSTGSACVAGPGATGWGQFCAKSTTPDPNHAHLRSTDSEETSFWSDDEHLSAAGQLIEANYEFTLIEENIAATPLPATLPMFGAGLAALGLVARRRKQKITA